MTSPLHLSRVCQVYTRNEVATIFKMLPGNIRQSDEGRRYPKRWDRAFANVLWRKVDVWQSLGLAVPTDSIPGAGDFFSTRRTADMFAVSMNTLSDVAHKGDIPSQRFDKGQYLFAKNDLEERLGASLVLWPAKADDPAYTSYQSSQQKSSRVESQDARPSIAGTIEESTFKRYVSEVVWDCIVSASKQDVFGPSHDRVRQMIQDAIDETWMGRSVELSEETMAGIGVAANHSLGKLINDSTLNLRLKDETLAEIKKAVAQEARDAVRAQMIFMFDTKKFKVELPAMATDLLLAEVGKEIRESVGRSLTSGAVEAVLSDQDVARVAEAARNAVRQTLTVIDPNTIPKVPPTTALRDRVRGVSNGR